MVCLAELSKIKFNMSKYAELFAEHGVDTSNTISSDRDKFLKDRDARLERDAKRQQEWYLKQQKAIYQQYSLWPNGEPLHFEFKDWKPAKQPDATEARKIGVKAFELSKQLVSKPFNVFLNGLPGVGKTSLALALMAEADKRDLSIMFVSTTVWLSLYDQKYNDERVADKLRNVVRAMKEVDTLVLDDFGTEGGALSRVQSAKSTGVRIDMQRDLYSIANARWNADQNQPKGHTIVTSNNLQNELERIYDTKIISRLIPQEKKYRIGFNKMTDVRGK